MLFGIELCELLGGHVALLLHRPDQQVTDEADGQKPRQYVHRRAVHLGLRRALIKLVLAESADQPGITCKLAGQT